MIRLWSARRESRPFGLSENYNLAEGCRDVKRDRALLEIRDGPVDHIHLGVPHINTESIQEQDFLR